MQDLRLGLFEPDQGFLVVEMIGGELRLLVAETQSVEELAEVARRIIDLKAQVNQVGDEVGGPARRRVTRRFRPGGLSGPLRFSAVKRDSLQHCRHQARPESGERAVLVFR